MRRAALDLDLVEAEARLTALLKGTSRRGVERLRWARLAQEIGAVEIALTELDAGLVEAPENDELKRERSELLRDVGRSEPAAPVASDAVESRSTFPSDDDLVRFLHRFAGREGVHARQWIAPGRRGGYSPIEAPLTPELLRRHLDGTMTLGTYVVRLDDTVTFFVVDIDLPKATVEAAEHDARRADEARATMHRAGLRARHVAAELGLELLLEDSGFKGRHLWGLLEDPLPADLVHRFGRLLVAHLDGTCDIHLEFFPKQRRVARGGLGNLVKLPLGVHLRSGRRSAFLDGETGAVVDDPWSVIRDAPRISRDAFMTVMAVLRDAVEPHEPSEPSAVATDAGLERVRGGCAVVRDVMERASASRRLTHDEQVVLTHSVGHFESGVEALRVLFEACPEVPVHAHPQRVRTGHPISCARIRARIPETTSRLPCHCELPGTDSHYPSPVLLGRDARG